MRKKMKNKRWKYFVEKKSILSQFFASILKFNLALAVFIGLAIIVNAGDVIVENGRIDVDSKLYVDTAGNVGIGTTGPHTKLDVVGEIIAEQSVDSYFMSLYPTGNNARLGFYSANRFDIGTVTNYAGGAWSPKVTVLNDGNVGIGTTAPAYKLDVVGDVRGTRLCIGTDCKDAWPAGGGNGSLPSGTLGQTLRHDGASWVASSLLNNSGADNIKIQNNNEVYLNLRNTEVNGRQYALVSAGSLGSIGVGKFSIYDATAGVSRLTIDSVGNIGIGTTGPAVKLDVLGATDGNQVAIFKNSDVDNGYGVLIDAGDDNNVFPLWIRKYDSVTDLFKVGGAGQVYMAGNVGIGTTVPGDKLHVVGGRTRLVPTAEPYALGLGRSEIGNFYYLGVTSDASPHLVFSNNAGTEQMRIQYGGNVGIGTTTPGAKLEVAGQIKITGGVPGAGKVLTSDASGLASWVTLSGGGTVTSISQGSGMTLSPNPITATGTVALNTGGISTCTNPTSNKIYWDSTNTRLTCGTDQTGAGGGITSINSMTGPAISIAAGSGISVSNSANTVTITNTGGGSQWATSGLNIYNTNVGNVGIGTANPNYKLQVGNFFDGTEARANAWNTLSDMRMKENLVLLDGALDKISSINGYYFNWKEGADARKHVGVLSQEVEKVMPEIISVDPDGFKSLDYGKLAPLLIEAVKELKADGDALRAENEALKARVEALEKR